MPEILGVNGPGGPGTHALVIGVSRYVHLSGGDDPTGVGAALGLDQLTCAARSAVRVAEWLRKAYRNPSAPLRSLHLLLSPQRDEPMPAALAGRTPEECRATRRNVERDVLAFVSLCAQNPDNVGFVYIAGHGVQLTKHGAIVLLDDLGSRDHVNVLSGAIDVAGCHAGMDHPGTARAQFWFVDSCRQVPDVARRFETMGGALSLDIRHGHCDTSPLFLASSTREAAFAKPGDTTLFAEALLRALGGEAAVGPSETDCPTWHVPVSRLLEILTESVRRASREIGEDQLVDVTGRVRPGIVQRFGDPPRVRLTLELLPERARSVSRATLLRNAHEPVQGLTAEWPIIADVDAGLYLLQVTSQPPFRSRSDILDVVPPIFARAVEVA